MLVRLLLGCAKLSRFAGPTQPQILCGPFPNRVLACSVTFLSPWLEITLGDRLLPEASVDIYRGLDGRGTPGKLLLIITTWGKPPLPSLVPHSTLKFDFFGTSQSL